MKRHSFFIALVGLFLLLATGCKGEVPEGISGGERTAAEYVLAQGYEILSYEGEGSISATSYLLTLP